MSYDEVFYALYDAYLKEPRVRAKHDALFDMWTTARGRKVALPIDLGCGYGQEYRRYCPGTPIYYGFDVNAEPEDETTDGSVTKILRASYRDPGFPNLIQELNYEPDVFVSLFSTELTATAAENTKLYERMFTEFPTITHALVAGMHYTDHLGAESVTEAGDLVSFQTFGEPAPTEIYEDLRIVTPVPSTLFGEKVVEVWRILTRR